MSRKIRNTIITVLLTCAMAALLFISLMNVNAMHRFSDVSLRYDEPISGQEAYQLRRFSIARSEDETFWPTFWHEAKAQIVTEYRTTHAPCILFSGDAALVIPANYLNGAAPGVTDGTGCAISSTLAHELWGGSDVVGKTIEVDGIERIIRGVFEDTQSIALISVRDEDTRQSFTAIELSGGPRSPTRTDVINFISASGLPTPDIILLSRPTFLASIMFALPLIILAIYTLAVFIVRIKKTPLILSAVTFSILLCLALILPILLETLPSWLLPPRFSDFTFWTTLTNQLGADLHEYLKLTPQLRDIAYMILFYKQIGISFMSTILALILCFLHTSRCQQITPEVIPSTFQAQRELL